MSAVPVLETERLILRGHEPADLDASAAVWADTGVVRFLSGKPSSREENWRRLLTYRGHWDMLGFGYWLIEEKATRRFVGDGGFGAFERDLGAMAFDAPEQGWALRSDAQGKGYAAEAVQAMIAWAEPHFGRSDFVCMIAPENERSLKLAHKVGYREYARASYQGEDEVLLRRA